MKKPVLAIGFVCMMCTGVYALPLENNSGRFYLASADGSSPRDKLFSYQTLSGIEILFLKGLELSGKVDPRGITAIDVGDEFNITDSFETDYGTQSYSVDIAIETAKFKDLTIACENDFILQDETDDSYIYTRKITICAEQVVLVGKVDAHYYDFTRNNVSIPEDNTEAGFFDRYNLHAAGYTDSAQLTLSGTTCVPIDINIRINKDTAKETYEHEVIPAYRNSEVAEGLPNTELENLVFTEVAFEGINLPTFLIPEEYAATAISTMLDGVLAGIILPAVAEEVFILDFPFVF